MNRRFCYRWIRYPDRFRYTSSMLPGERETTAGDEFASCSILRSSEYAPHDPLPVPLVQAAVPVHEKHRKVVRSCGTDGRRELGIATCREPERYQTTGEWIQSLNWPCRYIPTG